VTELQTLDEAGEVIDGEIIDGEIVDKESLDVLTAKANSIWDEMNTVGRTAGLTMLEQAWQMGGVLLKIKKVGVHGSWGQWLEVNFHGGERNAQNYMAIAKFAPQTSADLPASSIDGALKAIRAEKKKGKPEPTPNDNDPQPTPPESLPGLALSRIADLIASYEGLEDVLTELYESDYWTADVSKQIRENLTSLRQCTLTKPPAVSK
jgi:hypothetical protein